MDLFNVNDLKVLEVVDTLYAVVVKDDFFVLALIGQFILQEGEVFIAMHD